VEAAYGDQSLSSLQRYAKGRHWACHLILKETVRTALFIASVAAAVADERGLTSGFFLLRMEYRICS
jgi:hypothetical protein